MVPTSTKPMRLLTNSACSALAIASMISTASAKERASSPSIDPSADSEQVIIVTGSRIPRLDAVSASPVTFIARDEIERFPEVNLEEFLNELPQFTPDFSRSSNNPGNGTAQLNLRGLGPSRSLILLNGRRLTPQGTGSAIDINAIPSIMIDSVEIVTGGVSTVYGSDAVTGAVNFKTREIDGLMASGQFDIYGAGDGEAYNFSAVAGTGFADERGQVTVYADYLERTALLGSDRAFTEFVLSENSTTGALEPRGSSIVPEGIIFFPLAPIGGAIANPIFTPDGSIRAFEETDLFNFAADNFLQTPLQRWSGGLLADFDVADNLTLFTELMYARSRSDRQLAPATARLGIAFDIDSDFFNDQSRAILRASYDPDGDGVANAFFGKRLSEAGPRLSSRTGDYYRAVGGMRLELGQKWVMDAHYSYGRVDEADRSSNDVSRSRLQQAVLVDPATGACVNPAGGCVPANVFGDGNLSAEAIDFIRIAPYESTSRSVQHIGSFAATGPLSSWQAGDIYASFGAEYRSNSARFNPAAELATGDSLGFFATGEPVDGGFDVFELFAEATLPLLADRPFAQRLELEGGVRYSDYSNSGGVWTWKAGAQWVPVEGLRFRSSVQRAVRAPNIGELLESPAATPSVLPGIFDFCLASNDPVGNDLADVCVAQGMEPAQVGVYDAPPGSNPGAFRIPFVRVRSGNPELEPEKAKTFTAGVEYGRQGTVDFNVSASYFSIELDNAISADLNPFGVCAILKDPNSDVCLNITREPNGLIGTVADKPLNISTARVEGIDFGLGLSLDGPRWLTSATGGQDGRIQLRSLATRTLEIGLQSSPAVPFLDCAGGFSKDCGFSSGSTYPDFVINTTVSYNDSRFGASLRWRHVGPIENVQPQFDALSGITRPPLTIPSVGSRNYLDLGIRFSLSERLRLQAGVDNLLKTTPPLLGNQASQSNTDPARYDIFGRRFFIRFEARLGS